MHRRGVPRSSPAAPGPSPRQAASRSRGSAPRSKPWRDRGYWHAATRVEGPARARLTVELDVDLCVVGAGLAGLTVAREVARHGWSVVVLEAKSVGWSASGRNTGVVLPGFSVSADALIERVG